MKIKRSQGLTSSPSWDIYSVDGEVVSVSLKCATGHISSLWRAPPYRTDGKTHCIDTDGRVTPSAVCPHAGCQFHEFVTLEGWDGGEWR